MASLAGTFPAIVTPFTRGGRQVDFDWIGRHLAYLRRRGADGVLVLGTNGEGPSLSLPERKQVVAVTVDEVKKQLPVIAGAAACSTSETIMYARCYQDMGVDAVMVVPPYYGHLSQDELTYHYAALAEAVDLPIVVYNNPGTSGSDILPPTLARLTEFDNIVAIKESTGVMQRVADIMQRCGDHIEVMCGCDTLVMEMFAMGVEAWIAAPANVAAKACAQMYALMVVQKDFEKAWELYRRLRPLMDLFESSGQYVQLAKAGLELMGRSIGLPRKPLLPPSAELVASLKEILDSLE